MATAILLPLGLATLTRFAVYDGLRHFLFATVFIRGLEMANKGH